MNYSKLLAIEVFKLKENLQQTSLFSTTDLCSHSLPASDKLSLHLDLIPLVRIATVLQKSRQHKQIT